jgi:phenylpropionate dioxygenase-like ring-hydroxylating dioxygenase large terminal subunit
MSHRQIPLQNTVKITQKIMKLTTHLHLVTRLRMRVTLPPNPTRIHGIMVNHIDNFTFLRLGKVKCKVVPVLNQAPRHEDMLG